MAGLEDIDLGKQRLTPEEEETTLREIPVDGDQVELVTRLAVKMLKEGGGLQVLEKALQQSQDPAQVVGQFLVQLIAGLAENLSQRMELDPRIFLAPDGFLDHILNYIEQQLSLPPEFSDEVKAECLEMIRAMAQGETKPQPQAGPQQGAQPPQAGPAPGGLDQMGVM